MGKPCVINRTARFGGGWYFRGWEFGHLSVMITF